MRGRQTQSIKKVTSMENLKITPTMTMLPTDIWKKLGKLVLDPRALACVCVTAYGALKGTRELLLAASIRAGKPLYTLVTRRLYDYYRPIKVIDPDSLISRDNARLTFHVCGQTPPIDCIARICVVATATYAYYAERGIYLNGNEYSSENAIVFMKRHGFNTNVVRRTIITEKFIDHVIREFPEHVGKLAEIMANSRIVVRWLGYKRGLVPPGCVAACADALTDDQLIELVLDNPDVEVDLSSLSNRALNLLLEKVDMVDRVLRSPWRDTACTKYMMARLHNMTAAQLATALNLPGMKEYAIDVLHALQRQ